MTEPMSSPVLISGCARSGTSMVAGIIHLCGAFGGDMSGPNPSNPKGMFENSEVRGNITKPYLKSVGADPMGQYPLPNVNRMPIPHDWKQRVEKVFIDQGYKSGPWFYKGAKMCLMWPVWHKAFPRAKWVIVRRPIEQIINSCIRTRFMTAFSKPYIQQAIGVKNEREGWNWWALNHITRFLEMGARGLNLREVWANKIVAGDFQEIKDVVKWLGLEWNSEAESFVSPGLWGRK